MAESENTENTENQTTETPVEATADECLTALVQIATSLIEIAVDIKEVRNSLVLIQTFIGGGIDVNTDTN